MFKNIFIFNVVIEEFNVQIRVKLSKKAQRCIEVKKMFMECGGEPCAKEPDDIFRTLDNLQPSINNINSLI